MVPRILNIKNKIRIRPTVRLLVFDNQKRILLFHIHDHRPLHEAFPEMTVYWNTPGGGMEENESYEQAAMRELWEETGIKSESLGPCVWEYERILQLDRGKLQLQERFFVVTFPKSTVSSLNMLPYEREVIRAYRWWTSQELLTSPEQFQPGNLPQLLQPLFAGKLPSKPVHIRD